MRESDILILLLEIKGVYPYFDAKDITEKMWLYALGDADAKIVYDNLSWWIKNKNKPPAPADLLWKPELTFYEAQERRDKLLAGDREQILLEEGISENIPDHIVERLKKIGMFENDPLDGDTE